MIFAIPLLVLKSFFGGMFRGISSLFSGLFTMIGKYPYLFLGIAVLGISMWQTYGFAERRVSAKYEILLKATDAKTRALNDKIKLTEESSKAAATVAKIEIEAKKSEITRISVDYEARLLKERQNKKIEVIRVQPPPNNQGKVVSPVDVMFEDGQVVCRRLPTAFSDTINDIIDVANKKMGETK